ncbi:MAG: hypothetical protein Q8Q96_01085 [bacterium]|nr:hypothetical protein [bacterium]
MGYDEQSMLQIRLIAIETAVEKLNKAVGEFQQAHTGLERLGALENRIKTLEEVRLKQIEINTRVLAQLKVLNEPPKIIPKPVLPRKSFLDLFKR